jgi:exosortase A
MAINLAPSTAGAVDRSRPVRAWLPALIAIAAVGIVFAIGFQREIIAAVKVWNGSTAYNHCYLVLPVVAVLLWSRRAVIIGSRPVPTFWPLLLLPALAALWSAAALVDVMEIEQLAAVMLFEVLLIALLGWGLFRALLAPLLFLFFLVPFGAFLVPVLQRFTADFAAAGLQALGIPVFADGFIIQIPEGTFEVAEACAGLRFLIASIVFGCFFATVVYHSKWRRLAFVLLSIAAPVIANGLRALGLIVLAHLVGSAPAIETDHILYGWLFFTLVTLLLIGVGLTFADNTNGRDAVPARAFTNNAPRARTAAVAITGLILAMVGPGFLLLVESAAAAPLPPLSLRPALDSAWVRDAGSVTNWRPEALGAEEATTATYRHGSVAVTEFVARYPTPARGSLLTRTVDSVVAPHGWHTVATGRTTAAMGAMTAAMNTAITARDGKQRLIWWTYLVDGRATPSGLEARFLQARAALGDGRHSGALIAVSTEVDGFVMDNPTIAGFLKAVSLPSPMATPTQ